MVGEGYQHNERARAAITYPSKKATRQDTKNRQTAGSTTGKRASKRTRQQGNTGIWPIEAAVGIDFEFLGVVFGDISLTNNITRFQAFLWAIT